MIKLLDELMINENSPISDNRTSGERTAVSRALKSQHGEWTDMPDYATFDRKRALGKLDDVYKVVYHETDVDRGDLEEAYDKSRQFVHSTFDYFEKKGTDVLGRKVDRVFAVPMRSDRYNESYASESRPFVPLLDPDKYGVDSDIRMRAMYGYPPAVLDTYFSSDRPGESGVLVLTPMYTDMTPDLRPDKSNFEQTMRLVKVGSYIIEQTVRFAHERIGAQVMGLGAILPKLTNFGKALRDVPGMEHLITTTGHGGTVFMIVETVKKIMEETSVESRGRLGVIGGAGSIGWSSTVTMLDMIGDHKILTYDHNIESLGDKIAHYDESDKICTTGSAIDVLRNTDIIVTAVTRPIDLDQEDPEMLLDLTGKVIVDDSQPGCFDRMQVEARGGKLVWVVGEDGSDSGFMTRDGLYTDGVGYNYGDKSGLYGARSEFACGQEAAVIAKFKAHHNAIRGEVTPEDVRAIGRLFLDAGVRVAPFQAFGQPVSID